MNTGKNKHYQIIWRFLEHKLSDVEEDELMKWLEEENRNQNFFDEVVQDYELFLGASDISITSDNGNSTKDTELRVYHHWLFKVAAGIIMVFGLGYLFPLKTEKPEATSQTILLYDSTQILLSAGSQLIYDSLKFPETHSLQIKGEARIIPPQNKESLLLIETELGYYFSENAEITINNRADRNLEFEMHSGEAQWLNFEREKIEVDVSSGEKLLVERKHGDFYKQSIGLAGKEKKSSPFIKNNLLKLII